jgi:catechol 2,3-dioxygenase-like lactoylglutathione lyase family enzyme
MHVPAALVPELDVSDLAVSRRFYVELVGFEELYGRPEETFLYLRLGGADLMLEETEGPGRRFRSAVLERPFGRGINLQIAHPSLTLAYHRLIESDARMLVPMETRTYCTGQGDVRVEQFVVEDPDGYLLRFQRAHTPQ